MKRIKFILLLLIIAGNIMAETDAEKETRLRNLAVDDLSKARTWVIENIIEYSYTDENSQKNIQHLLSKKFYVSKKFSTYRVDDERSILSITITTRGIYNFIKCYARKEYEGKFYEYWVVNIDGTDWSGVNRDAEFIITRADTIHGKREIIKKESQFFDDYIIEKDITLFFPKDNWNLFELESWLYPLNYKKSDLNETYIWVEDRIDNKEDPYAINDIIWGSRKLTKDEIEMMENYQLNGGNGILSSGYKFSSEQ